MHHTVKEKRTSITVEGMYIYVRKTFIYEVYYEDDYENNRYRGRV